ncbi:hypothetical protein E1162_17535 [Rhodobacteraceae bacterium RKSG542]|nr:hypothetical protein [Pseudovibrio flavus]
MSEINYIQETGFQLGNPSPVARRYCAARAILSDGSHRALYYMVVEHDGFVGVSWNVQACLDGLDKYRVYDGRCRTVRISPF